MAKHPSLRRRSGRSIVETHSTRGFERFAGGRQRHQNMAVRTGKTVELTIVSGTHKLTDASAQNLVKTAMSHFDRQSTEAELIAASVSVGQTLPTRRLTRA